MKGNSAKGRVVIFRADGGQEIGMGHIMRCIGLAQEFSQRGYRPFFVSASHSESVASRLAHEGFEYQSLECQIGTKQDLQQLLSLCKQLGCCFVIADGYEFNANWLGGIKAADVNVMLWTDYLQAESLPVDIILDQTPADNAAAYKRAALPHTRILNGLDYVVLRDEFLKHLEIRRVRSSVDRVLITFGGSDSPGGTIKVLNALADAGFNTCFDVVVGPANPWLDDIVKVTESMDSALVHIATKDMAELIASADLAVSAAGASLWEFAYSGLPAIAMSIAENQLPLASSLDKFACGVNLGPVSGFSESRFIDAFEQLMSEPGIVEEFSKVLLSLVDGAGRQRVVDSVEKYLEPA